MQGKEKGLAGANQDSETAWREVDYDWRYLRRLESSSLEVWLEGVLRGRHACWMPRFRYFLRELGKRSSVSWYTAKDN